MSEYRHTIHRGQLQGASTDPPQNISNAGDAGVDQSLTLQNAAVIGIAAMTAKKLISNVGGAIIEQQGNTNIENFVQGTSFIAGYVALGFATGFNPYVLGAKAVTDIASLGIQNFVNKQATDWDNELIQKSRGVTRSMIGGNYYD